MLADMKCGELYGSAIVNHEPLGMTVARNEQQFDTVLCSSEMFDVGASETTATHNSILRRARPAAFDRHRTNATAKRNLPAHHAPCAAREAMFFMPLKLNAGAGTIRFTGQ